MDWRATIAAALLASCTAPEGTDPSHPSTDLTTTSTSQPEQGSVTFSIAAAPATRLEVWLYAEPFAESERLVLELARQGDHWTGEVSREELDDHGIDVVFYGLRAWGPNWPWDPEWQPGSSAGFIADVDENGHRFNPNKLLIDPSAREISHDPIHAGNVDIWPFTTGPDHRNEDSASIAPKGIVLPSDLPEVEALPAAELRNQVIYEVHVRGLTQNDPSVPIDLQGTYAGAALKANYLADLGVTAIEFQPVHETQNDQNDLDPNSNDGDNYWGYSSLSFFAPDRRYAADNSPGGPTREFRDMVRIFHNAGISVYLDVVYNHTGESGPWDGDGLVTPMHSWRGLDNPGYYELAADPAGYRVDNGVGPNWNSASSLGRQTVLDSLHYWVEEMGVDGFRFDLAAVLGNSCDRDCFNYDATDPNGILQRAHAELPDTVLMAEPWGIGWGTYQIGAFPAGWAEWNGSYRDDLRNDQNRMGISDVTPGALANRLSGSWDLFGDDGRAPWHSVNYLVSHDGFALRDLYSCSEKDNGQPYPYGPSDGGADDESSWDHGGDPVAQKHAARTGMALLMLSAGVPMITGGDEFYRTQRCNNNPYNLDSVGTWLDPTNAAENAAFAQFAREAMRFRGAHPALRPEQYRPASDDDGDGLQRISWRTTGGVADGAYMDDPTNHFLAFQLDGDEVGDSAASIFVAYNGWDGGLDVTIPPPANGRAWYLVADTHPWLEDEGNWYAPGAEVRYDDGQYLLGARSVLVLIEK